MKSFLFMALVSLFAAPAFATPDACVDFMPCGVYEGAGSWYNAEGQPTAGRAYSEKIEITKVDDLTVNLKVYIYKGTIGQPWTDSNVKFKADGTFAIQHHTGREFGTGYCGHNVCTVAFRPVNVTDEGATFVNAFVNTLRFEGANLKRYNMVSNSSVDSELAFQRSTLTKK